MLGALKRRIVLVEVEGDETADRDDPRQGMQPAKPEGSLV
jgi:hypothetical protein